jgi:hypothetical protein
MVLRYIKKPAKAAALKPKQAEGAVGPPEAEVVPAAPSVFCAPEAERAIEADQKKITSAGAPLSAGAVLTLPPMTQQPEGVVSPPKALTAPAAHSAAPTPFCPAGPKSSVKAVTNKVTSASTAVLPLGPLLTLPQVADLLQVCVKTVRRNIKALNVPVVYVGKQIRVPAEHVALFIKKKW